MSHRERERERGVEEDGENINYPYILAKASTSKSMGFLGGF